MKKKIIFIFAIIITIFIYFNINAVVKDEDESENFANVVLFAHFSDASENTKEYFNNKDNRDKIIEIYNGGLAIHGGIIAGAIFFIYYSKKNKMNFLKIFDLTAPALILGQAIGRWGNFINQEAHGPAVLKQTLENLPIPNFVIKGMNINGTYYHPTFYYESVWDFLGFILLIILRKKLNLKTGQLTGIYFVWYSTARFLIESLRTDSLMLGPIKVAQAVSIILFLLGLYLILRKKKDTRTNRNKERNDINEN